MIALKRTTLIHGMPTRWEMSVKRVGQLEMYRHCRCARVCGVVAAFCAVVLLTACGPPKLTLTKFTCTMDNGDSYQIAVADSSNVRVNNRILTDGGTVTIEDLVWNVTVSDDNDHTIVSMQRVIGSSGSSSLLPTSGNASYEMDYDLDRNNGTLSVAVLRAGNLERRRTGKCVKNA